LPANDLALLKEAAREAGVIALRHFRSTPEVWDKPGGAGPVSEADLEVDRMLRHELLAARQGYGWLSEETEDDPGRLGTERLFIVDPIDGTRAFLEGSEDWAISLATARAGRITAAVVYLPARKLMFAAHRGGGASVNGMPVHVADDRPLEETDILATRPNFAAEHWKAGAPPAVKRSFRSSLAYRLCLVAEGRYDAMLTLRPAWEWDIAAGSLIVTEAKGQATNRAGQQLIFNNPGAQIDGLVAGGPAQSKLIDLLAHPAPA
jgi:myo-inositol-1(or 4)-monophosphatase